MNDLIYEIKDNKKYGYLNNYIKPKKIYLPKKMTIKEIYAKLNKYSYKFKNEFKLVNRFLFGKKIKFKCDKDLKMKIILKVKGYAVTTEAFVYESVMYIGFFRIHLFQEKSHDEIILNRYNYVKQVNDTIIEILI